MIEPTWESDCGRVKLWLGDCLEVMASWPDGAVDCIVTDPPYGIAYNSGNKGKLPRNIVGDESTLLRDVVIQRPEPRAVFATWRCVPPQRPRGCLVWAKNAGGMGDLDFPWRLDFELIWIFGKGWTGYRGSSVLRASTVVTWNSGPAKRVHPHEKPVDLIEKIILKSPGNVIADPLMGSGTTGVAAVRSGRQFWGVEIEEEYFEIAKQRIQNELKKQQSSFGLSAQTAATTREKPTLLPDIQKKRKRKT